MGQFPRTGRGTLTRGIGGKVWIKHMLEFLFENFYTCPIFENGLYFEKCFGTKFLKCLLLILGLAGAGSQVLSLNYNQS